MKNEGKEGGKCEVRGGTWRAEFGRGRGGTAPFCSMLFCGVACRGHHGPHCSAKEQIQELHCTLCVYVCACVRERGIQVQVL